MTWNVGGMPTNRLKEIVGMLPALRLGKVESPRAPGSVVPTGSFGNDLRPWNE